MERAEQLINLKVFDKSNQQLLDINCPAMALISMFTILYCPEVEHIVTVTWPNGHSITTDLSNPKCWSF